MITFQPDESLIQLEHVQVDLHKYRGWTKDTDPETARQAFIAEYGCEPETMTIYKQLLLVGPIPDENIIS